MAETFTGQLLLGRTGRAKGMDDSGERGRVKEGRRGARQEAGTEQGREGHVPCIRSWVGKGRSECGRIPTQILWWKAKGAHVIFIFCVVEARSSILILCHMEG